MTVSELPDKMPEAIPRFNLYRYSHVKEGKYTEFVPGELVFCDFKSNGVFNSSLWKVQ